MAVLKDLMTARVVTVRADEPISAAVERMTRFGFSAVPVVSGAARLVGMVSLLDVLRYREVHEAEGLEADERVPVAEVMNPEVVSMSATANAAAVAHRLRSHGQLRVMPVVQGGRLVGVVTRSDLLRHRHGARDAGASRGLLGRLFAAAAPVEDALFAMTRTLLHGPAPASGASVRDVMTTDVVSVTAADPVVLAATLMLRDRHTALPVVAEDGRLVGVISEADLLADPHAGRSHGVVGGVMTRTPISLDVTATVGEARALVADRGLRMVPVVDDGCVVGVISRSDLVQPR